MRRLSIPTLAVPSALAKTIVAVALLSYCEAFGTLTTKSRTDISATSVRIRKDKFFLSRYQDRKELGFFLKSINDIGESPIDSIEEVESRISAMKVVELRAELKSHGQPTSGLKKVLQQRLLNFYSTEMSTFDEGSTSNNNDNDNDNQGNNDDGEDIEGEEHENEGTLELERKKSADSNADIFVAHDYGDESAPSESSSKQKWKKKVYLMLEDVRKVVHSDDAVIRERGPAKARNTVRRMQRWISSSYSDSLFSIGVEDDLDVVEPGEFEPVRIVDIDSETDTEFRNYQRRSLLRAYNLWIHSIAKSGNDDAGELAEQVLYEMKQNIPNGGPSPDKITISTVMDAHAHSATVSSSKSGAEAAGNFLFELLEKQEADHGEDDMPWSHDGENALRESLIVTCDIMLNALAREGTIESAERAQLIVLRMEEYQRQKEKERETSGSKKSRKKSLSEKEMSVISANAKRPISYATVMNAWANVGSAKAAEHAETALESLVQRAKADIKENKEHDERSRLVLVQPDTVVFNSVIQCWATSGDVRAGKKALRLLEQMKELAGTSSTEENDDKIYFDTHPDIITYNTVLSAWSHCGKKNAAPRAESIIKELVMEQQKNEETGAAFVAANTITFNTVLHAWSKSKLSGATDRAEKLLEYMIKSSNSEIRPDVYSFTCVMDTWAKSKEPNKALRTRKLLDQLIEMRQEALKNRDKRRANVLLPSQIPYNTVLNACAFSAMKTPEEEKREAITIAVDTFKGMSSRESSFQGNANEKAVARDAVTYGLMLKCIANLMPRGTVRTRMALQIFQECCDDGLVGYLVWNEVRRAVPAKVLQEVYRFKRQCGSMEVEDLPREWNANCRERRSNKHRKQNDRKRKTKAEENEEKTQPKTFIIERSFSTGKDM